MKKFFFGCAVLLATAALAVSCATFATNGEVPQKTIPILSFVSGSLVPTGEEIASYTKFIGICIGYDDFVAAVQGQDYDVVEKFYLFFSKVSAVAK
jgi:hypothetical protein